MPASAKPEFPPLFQAGFHQLSMSALRDLCVAKFPLSTTRTGIMDGLEQLVAELSRVGVVGDLWIDGSFLTEKIDPSDVDLVLSVSHDVVDSGPSPQHDAVAWFSSADLKSLYKCHCFAVIVRPKGHPLYKSSAERKDYWERAFGFALLSHEPKGIGVIRLPVRQQ
jgi:hypothetical protein